MQRSALLVLGMLFGAGNLVGGSGCAGKTGTADRLMKQTTVGQGRCSEVDPTKRPFVVEWDATDTAMFESFAQRDVVVVRYVGCELEVLTACNDDGIAGRYGAYNAPMWTSGSVEGFDIRDEFDLYAKLPLGASSFAGKVAAGSTLQLQYFISGTVTATRNGLGKGDLAENPRCEGATHFVQAYNLGAFELNATEGRETRLEASHQGVGAGGGRKRSEARLKQGGDLGSCTAEEAKELTRCQVPIRLVLRELDDGKATALAAPAAAAEPVGGKAQGGSAKQVAALYDSALRKFSNKDGAGCLSDLNRAKKLDGEAAKQHEMMRAQCEMKAGRCKDGKKRYRKWLQQSTQGGALSPGEIDAAVTSVATKHCAGGKSSGPEKAARLSQDIEAASRKPDLKTCARLGSKLLPLVGKLKTRDKYEQGAAAQAVSALQTAARCADKLGQCKDAKRLLRGHIDSNKGIKPADRKIHYDAAAKRELKRCGAK